MPKEVEIRELLNEAKFIEMLATDPFGKGIDLDHWQVGYVQDRNPFLLVEKSRRTGYSWAESLTGLIRSQTIVRRTMPYVYSKYYISRNLDESKEKITLARVFHDMLPKDHRLKLVSDQKTELLFEDNYGRLSRLKALTAQPPRGPGGDVNIDEAAWIRGLKQVFEAALYIIGEGQEMQLSMGSSPAGKNGLFYDIATNKLGSDGRALYKHFRRYRIPWWLSRNLCRDILRASIEAPAMSTRDRVYKFGTKTLVYIFETTTLDNFVRECECGYMDESAAYMPYELIWSCRRELYSDEPSDPDANYFFQYFRNDEQSEPPESFWRKLRDNRRGIVEIGYDVGRTGHMSALCVTDEVEGRRSVRALCRLDKCPFPVQRQILRDAVKITQPIALRIDKNGLGMQLAEELNNDHGSIVLGVDLTNTSKAYMATAIKAAFEGGEIEIPDHPEFINHLHSIEREVTDSLVRYDSQSEDHHGDFFWALGLTYYRGDLVTSVNYKVAGKRISTQGIPI